MCIIVVSGSGVKQPTKEVLSRCFLANPHGAGFMWPEGGRVRISKGYMSFDEFWEAVRSHRFTKRDVVVYHFRISTQAGVNPEMTQPFGFTDDIVKTKALELSASLGIAHNGIIRAFSDPFDTEYSDTAHFVAEFLPEVIHRAEDFTEDFLEGLGRSTHSRFAFLDGSGRVFLAGDWIEDGGLMFSNFSYDRFTRRYVK